MNPNSYIQRGLRQIIINLKEISTLPNWKKQLGISKKYRSTWPRQHKKLRKAVKLNCDHPTRYANPGFVAPYSSDVSFVEINDYLRLPRG